MSVPAYPAYKDSGQEWLGAVPTPWSTRPVSSLFATVSSGTTPPTEAHHYYAGDICWVTTGELRESVISDTEKHVTEDAVRDLSALKVYPPGTLLIALYGATIGRLGILAVDACTNQACCAMAHPRDIDVLFAFYCLVAAREHLLVIASGGGQPNINQDKIRSLRLPHPSLPEQSAIAAFLDRETGKIDALVAEQERLMALLKEKRQAVISHAVTRGLNPNAKMKPSGVEWLGEVAQGWEVTRLKFLAEVQGGIAKGRDVSNVMTIQVPYIRVANVQAGYLDLDEITMIDIEPHELERYALRAGDVLMNEGGDFDKLGRGAIWRGEIDPCIHQNHVFAVRPHNIEPEWLTLVTSADYGRFFFMSYAKQSTNLASISSTNLQEIPVVCPPPDERARIVEHVNTEVGQLNTLTAEATRAIGLLKERRAALISAAVTGKVDVRDLAPAEAAA